MRSHIVCSRLYLLLALGGTPGAGPDLELDSGANPSFGPGPVPVFSVSSSTILPHLPPLPVLLRPRSLLSAHGTTLCTSSSLKFTPTGGVVAFLSSFSCPLESAHLAASRVTSVASMSFSIHGEFWMRRMSGVMYVFRKWMSVRSQR